MKNLSAILALAILLTVGLAYSDSTVNNEVQKKLKIKIKENQTNGIF